MAQFMLILHDRPADFSDVSAEEIQSIVGEYVAWRQRLEGQGRLIGGEKLADEGGRQLSLVDGGVRVTDGPYSEAKEIVGGYFTIAAEDYDEAVELCRDCPHLKYGERIELRRIDDVHG
ncbi:MAG: YciI family protein [Acidobacteriota bacterium]